MRTTSEELHADAVEALLEALHATGLEASHSREPSRGPDLVLHTPAGPILIEVKAASVVNEARAAALRGDPASGGTPAPAARIVVADQLSEGARRVLREANCGYLDRRGALWLRAPGVFVHDTTLDSFERQRATRRAEPIRGRVGLGVALRRLMLPDARDSVRGLAAAVGASVSSVHDALTGLRDAALLDAGGRPLVPDLFDAAASIWRPERIPVRRHPEADDADAKDWVVGSDVGAAAAGARVVVSSSAPPDFYVPSEVALRRAVRRLGECAHDERAATVALAPSPLVIAEPHPVVAYAAHGSRWSVAHPVVLALDLAQDQARGREILDEWTPEGVSRVW